MLGLVLGTLRLPLIVAIAGSPLAAAGTNIAISAARRAPARCAMRASAASTASGRLDGATVRPRRRARRAPRRRRLGAAALCRDRGGAGLERRRPRPAAGRAAGPRAARLWPAVVGGFGIGALGGAVGVILEDLRTDPHPRRRPRRQAGGGNEPRRRLPARRASRPTPARSVSTGRSCWPASRARSRAAGSARRRPDATTRTCCGRRSGSCSCSSAPSSPCRRASCPRRRRDRLCELPAARRPRQREHRASADRRTRLAGSREIAITRTRGKTARRSETRRAP